ncbi:hypothetical protein LGK95_10365 [Clostridium algoriphilum]|uniref:hypothetical protein n=1 Tax=Clostridium algoriphilum TaxID=198347 RepID=UPI001CF2AE75|nr:hypothetical protein [Clostridium algoriphilum]MCB2293924.1 hypothetical protein [Clostridium algoriphilum]
MRIYGRRSWAEKLNTNKRIDTKKLGDSHIWELLKFIEIYIFGSFFVVKLAFSDINIMAKK